MCKTYKTCLPKVGAVSDVLKNKATQRGGRSCDISKADIDVESPGIYTK